MTTDADSRVILANSIDRLADAIDHLAVASQAIGVPKAAPAAQPLAPPNGPPAAAKPEKTVQQKRGGLIYFACRDNGWANKSAEIGEQILGRPMNNDSRLWPDADQIAVLERMKEWNWIEDRGVTTDIFFVGAGTLAAYWLITGLAQLNRNRRRRRTWWREHAE